MVWGRGGDAIPLKLNHDKEIFSAHILRIPGVNLNMKVFDKLSSDPVIHL